MSTPAPLRLATRRSALAMAQSRLVGEQLSAMTGRPLELVEVTTQGDVDDSPLTQIGGTGVFVVAVRQALLDGRADVAVHSLKDLPTTPDRRLRLASIPPREDPRDALVAHDGATLSTLVSGARVGTGSPRRRAQLAAARPDLELVEIRGNIDTRLARVASASPRPGAGRGPGDLDAVVLACAGLVRLGRQARICELFDPGVVMPAPGQGALAIEVRSEEFSVLASGHVQGQVDEQGEGQSEGRAGALDVALGALDDAHTRAAVVAERSLLATLEAGCSAPVGALAVVVDGPSPEILLRAVMAGPDGPLLRASDTGPLEEPELLGRRLAERLLSRSQARTENRTSDPSSRTTPTVATGSIRATGPTSIHRGSTA